MDAADSADARGCSQMLVDVRGCSRMLADARGCPRMLRGCCCMTCDSDGQMSTVSQAGQLRRIWSQIWPSTPQWMFVQVLGHVCEGEALLGP